MHTHDPITKINKKNTEKLLIGFDKNNHIIQFNKSCESYSGYKRQHILKSDIIEKLVPESHRREWNQIIEHARKDRTVHNKIIPWVNSKGEEILISWSTLPIKSDLGIIEDICLVGTTSAPPSDTSTPHLVKDTNKTVSTISTSTKNQNTSANTKHQQKQKTHAKDIKKSPAPIKKPSSNRKKIKLKINKSKHTRDKASGDKVPDTTSKDKRIDQLQKRIRQLEQRDKKLERKNNRLQKQLLAFRERLEKIAPSPLESVEPIKHDAFSIYNSRKSKLRPIKKIIFDPFGRKKRNLEYQRKLHELNEYKEKLNALKEELITDKEKLDEQRQSFQDWKEKLEQLESEINKRQQKLFKQEIFIKDIAQEGPDKTNQPGTQEDIPLMNEHQILDKISQSAAVIQRGILKKINPSFLQLIGYSREELIDKNLIDFIAPEGLADVQQYYLKRLKGDHLSSFPTVFMTKKNEKVPVNIKVKETQYNGEKAELVLVQKEQNGEDNASPQTNASS